VRTATYDVAIIGGGPAGLAVAIESAQRGLATVVVERSPYPPDKACGEGLMPIGLCWLEAAGVRALIPSADRTPLESIRWIEQGGSHLVGRLPSPGGLGVRRTALTAALARRAVEHGAELRFGCTARRREWTADEVIVETGSGEIRAKLLVAADGLHSPVRRASGLGRRLALPRRFGLRRHFRLAPWSREVEVYLRPGIQAFVTPAGDRRVGIAFLWEPDAVDVRPDFSAFLQLFPSLAERIAGVEPDSHPQGAGPLAQCSRLPIADRLVLVGDAAGFVDAISGEGLTLAFRSAAVLGELLPRTLARGATRAALAPYAHAYRRLFRSYMLYTRALLVLARRPRLRRAVTQTLRVVPGVVDRLMTLALS
jgi:flavin-dependent dehydrogenase